MYSLALIIVITAFVGAIIGGCMVISGKFAYTMYKMWPLIYPLLKKALDGRMDGNIMGALLSGDGNAGVTGKSGSVDLIRKAGCIELRYNYYGTEHSIHLPYSHEWAEVEIRLKKDDALHKLNFPAGVPLFVPAHSLGGDAYHITMENGDVVVIEGNVVPPLSVASLVVAKVE